jgi:tripartite-type tricarboxylate transporter receptor subunit TctC
MKLPRRKFLQLAAGTAALPAVSRLASAQTYPSQRITMVVPFAAGAAADTIARVVAEGMRPKLGQPIVIENVGGADGSIGAGRVAHAAPDGYTLLAGPLNIHLASSASYDVVKDFEPIGLLAESPMLLIVKKVMPANNVGEFIAWLKANPDKSSIGTAGAGSPPHLLGLLLQTQTGTQFDLVHYRGGGLAMLDIVAGHIVHQRRGCIAAARFGQCESPWRGGAKTHANSAGNPDNGRGGTARILSLGMGRAVCA